MSIEMEAYLKNMGLASLAARCSREINAAARGEVYNEQYWSEWLSRAAGKRNDIVRQALLPHLRQLLRVWLDAHPCKEQAFRLEREEYYVARACELFWQAVSERKPGFDRLPMALRYLRANLNSVILDALRTHARFALVASGDAVGMEDLGELALKGNKVDWKSICELLAGAREQRMAYLLFTRGLRPKDIIRLYPQEFSSLQEISQLRYAVTKQLLTGGANATDAGQ